MAEKRVSTGLALLSARLAFYVYLALAICGQASADQFLWYNDPNSTVDFSAVSRSCPQTPSGVCPNNTIRYSDFRVVNTINQPLSDVGFFIPTAWPRIFNPDGSIQATFALTWRNDLNGWYTGNFDNTGTSLLVTATIETPNNTPNGRIAAGSVAADQTLTQLLTDLTAPECAILSAPCFVSPVQPVPETLALGDLVPFVDLGSLPALGSENIDVVLTYHWGDGRTCCALRTSFGTFTLAPVAEPPAPVPEPGTISLLGVGLAGLILYRLRQIGK